MFGYVLHLTPHTSHGALTFIDYILQDKNLCDRCLVMFYTSHLTPHTSHGALTFIDYILQDKNLCDRCNINDKVNQMNLYFQTVSILGWAVGLHD